MVYDRYKRGGQTSTTPRPETMTKIILSSRFAAFLGDAERVAQILINRPQVIGAHRATLLLNLAKTDRRGRRALQACADASGRSVVTRHGVTIGDRVFNKASTARLARWAQNLPTSV